jgi:hypothetical protein
MKISPAICSRISRGFSCCASLRPAAWGCSPIKSIGVVFARNSARSQPIRFSSLPNWTSMLRREYPNREAIFMTTQAAFGENDASELGVRRARNVAKVLRGFAVRCAANQASCRRVRRHHPGARGKRSGQARRYRLSASLPTRVPVPDGRPSLQAAGSAVMKRTNADGIAGYVVWDEVFYAS